MIDLLKGYLDTGWRTRKEIINYLGSKGVDLDERELRREVAKYNQGYINGEHDTYVCYDNGRVHQGLLLTADRSIIRDSIQNDKERFMTLLRRYYGVKKRLREDDQITLLDNGEIDAYEVLLKVNV